MFLIGMGHPAHESVYALVADADKALDVPLVVVNNAIPECKYIHKNACFTSQSLWTGIPAHCAFGRKLIFIVLLIQPFNERNHRDSRFSRCQGMNPAFTLQLQSVAIQQVLALPKALFYCADELLLLEPSLIKRNHRTYQPVGNQNPEEYQPQPRIPAIFLDVAGAKIEYLRNFQQGHTYGFLEEEQEPLPQRFDVAFETVC